MKKINFKRGFTLIELLVVVAIIGILASVVLASLNSARSKGTDAAIKAGLASARTQGELYYTDNGLSYQNVCTTATNATPAGGIMTILNGAASKLASSNTITSNSFIYSSSGSTNSAVCHDNASGWAAMVSLKSPSCTGGSCGWCVDSSGASKESNSLAAGVIVCP